MAERKKLLWIVLIILSSTFMTESILSDCKRPWVSIGSGCYNFENLLQSIERYSDAINFCLLDSYPVDIGNEEELQILSLAVKARRLLSRIPLNGIWTGGSRTSNMENYYWKISGISIHGELVHEIKQVRYFAWLNQDTPLQNRNNHLALGFNATTGLLGYMDVNPEYPKGLGLVCKGIVCPPRICTYDTKCVRVFDTNGCIVCSECGGKGCKVQVDVEFDGSAACTTCYCKKECDDVEKCQHGCHLVPSGDGCPKCECPAEIVPLDIQLTFTKIVPNALNLICLTVDKLVGVSEICTKRVVVRCHPTLTLQDKDGDVTVTVGIVTLSIKTSYTNFISVLNECKYFLQNNLLRKIGSHTVQNVLIEVPDYMPIPPPVTQSTCLKPKGNLTCDDTNKFYELRWEFNSRIGYCRPYVHNGCQTDKENSFKTLLECQTRCSEACCFLPRNPGSCGFYIEQWTYNPYTGICELFRGCVIGAGNSNRFLTEDECYLACQGVVCAEPPDVGPCSSRSVEPRYHYDITTKKCNVLNWGGCFGNGNKFESYNSCEQGTCDTQINLTDETTTLEKATSAVETTDEPENLPPTRYINRAPCICTVEGDPKVTTFDGSALLIDGIGPYLLLETGYPEEGQRFVLAVETEQAAPRQYPGLLRIVRVYFKAESQLTVVENGSVQIDGRPVTVLPSTVSDVTVSGVIGDHVTISHSIGYYVTVKFGQTAQDTHVLLSIQDNILSSPTGLCGNCNSNPADEFVVDSEDLSNDPERYQKISRAYRRDQRFILSN